MKRITVDLTKDTAALPDGSVVPVRPLKVEHFHTGDVHSCPHCGPEAMLRAHGFGAQAPAKKSRRVTLVLEMPEDPANVGGIQLDWKFVLATDRAKIVAVRDGDWLADVPAPKVPPQ